MYSIIIFLVFVVPIANKKYFSNYEVSLFSKLLNFIFSLLIFSIFFDEFRTILWDFYDNKVFLNQKEVLRCPFDVLYCNLVKVLYMLSCLYIAASSLGLGRGNNKSRKRFLSHIKYIWIVLTLYFASRVYVLDIEQSANIITVIFITSINTGIAGVIVYLFYNSVYIKKLFLSDSISPQNQKPNLPT